MSTQIICESFRTSPNLWTSWNTKSLDFGVIANFHYGVSWRQFCANFCLITMWISHLILQKQKKGSKSSQNQGQHDPPQPKKRYPVFLACFWVWFWIGGESVCLLGIYLFYPFYCCLQCPKWIYLCTYYFVLFFVCSEIYSGSLKSIVAVQEELIPK